MRGRRAFLILFLVAACSSSERKADYERKEPAPSPAKSLDRSLPDPEGKISASLKPRARPLVPEEQPLKTGPYRAEPKRERPEDGPRLTLPGAMALAERGAPLPSRLDLACLVVENGRVLDRRSRAIAGELSRGQAKGSKEKAFALTGFTKDQELAAALGIAVKRGAGLLALCQLDKERSFLIIDAERKAVLARVSAGRRELAQDGPFLTDLVERLARLWQAD